MGTLWHLPKPLVEQQEPWGAAGWWGVTLLSVTTAKEPEREQGDRSDRVWMKGSDEWQRTPPCSDLWRSVLSSLGVRDSS